MMQRPLILVTNDDGIDSPGLAAAARAALRVGDVVIAAPNEQQTAMGRAYPGREDLGERAADRNGKSLSGQRRSWHHRYCQN